MCEGVNALGNVNGKCPREEVASEEPVDRQNRSDVRGRTRSSGLTPIVAFVKKTWTWSPAFRSKQAKRKTTVETSVLDLPVTQTKHSLSHSFYTCAWQFWKYMEGHYWSFIRLVMTGSIASHAELAPGPRVIIIIFLPHRLVRPAMIFAMVYYDTSWIFS